MKADIESLVVTGEEKGGHRCRGSRRRQSQAPSLGRESKLGKLQTILNTANNLQLGVHFQPGDFAESRRRQSTALHRPRVLPYRSAHRICHNSPRRSSVFLCAVLANLLLSMAMTPQAMSSRKTPTTLNNGNWMILPEPD